MMLASTWLLCLALQLASSDAADCYPPTDLTTVELSSIVVIDFVRDNRIISTGCNLAITVTNAPTYISTTLTCTRSLRTTLSALRSLVSASSTTSTVSEDLILTASSDLAIARSTTSATGVTPPTVSAASSILPVTPNGVFDSSTSSTQLSTIVTDSGKLTFSASSPSAGSVVVFSFTTSNQVASSTSSSTSLTTTPDTDVSSSPTLSSATMLNGSPIQLASTSSSVLSSSIIKASSALLTSSTVSSLSTPLSTSPDISGGFIRTDLSPTAYSASEATAITQSVSVLNSQQTVNNSTSQSSSSSISVILSAVDQSQSTSALAPTPITTSLPTAASTTGTPASSISSNSVANPATVTDSTTVYASNTSALTAAQVSVSVEASTSTEPLASEALGSSIISSEAPSIATITSSTIAATASSTVSSTAPSAEPSLLEIARFFGNSTGPPNCYEFSIYDETVNDGFAILCSTEVNTGTTISNTTQPDLVACREQCRNFVAPDGSHCVAATFAEQGDTQGSCVLRSDVPDYVLLKASSFFSTAMLVAGPFAKEFQIAQLDIPIYREAPTDDDPDSQSTSLDSASSTSASQPSQTMTAGIAGTTSVNGINFIPLENETITPIICPTYDGVTIGRGAFVYGVQCAQAIDGDTAGTFNAVTTRSFFRHCLNECNLASIAVPFSCAGVSFSPIAQVSQNNCILKRNIRGYIPSDVVNSATYKTSFLFLS